MKIWRLVTVLQLGSAVMLAAGPFLLLWVVDNTLSAVAGGLLISSILRALLAGTLAYLATHRYVEPRSYDEAWAMNGSVHLGCDLTWRLRSHS